MLPSTNIQSIIGATLFGPDREKIGRVTQVYVDAVDGHPTWAEVHVGTLARHSTFVPLNEASWEDDDVFVPYDKELVKSAPRMETSGGLNPAQEEELGRHYAGEPVTRDDRDDRDVRDDHADRDDRDRVGATPDRVDETSDRGEPVAVPSDRAEARSGTDAAAPTRQLDENGVLWEERVVVSKERVPVAKVHLETTTVTEEQEVTAEVQKERVVVEERRTGADQEADGHRAADADRLPHGDQPRI